MKLKKGVILVICILISTFMVGCSKEASSANEKNNGSEAGNETPEKIIFVFLPNEETADDNRKLGRDMMMEDMSEFIGIPVEVLIADDYNAVIETMRNGNAQIASFGPFSYIIAHDRSNAEAIAITAKNEEDSSYNSYIITHKDTGITDIKDIEGKSMTFVDPASTSGNLVPRAAIVKELGVIPEEVDGIFSSVQFAGNHDNSFLAVANKSVEVGAVSNTTYEKALREGIVNEEDIVILAESAPIPKSPIAIHGDLPQEVKDKIIEFFNTYDNQEYFTLSGAEGSKFLTVDDSKYDGIREVAESMNLSPDELLK